MKQFIQDHFDKLLLSVMFLLMLGIIVYLIHLTTLGTGGESFVNWAENEAGTVLGALLMLITGGIKAAFDRKETNANNSGAVDSQVSDQESK